MVIFSVVLVRNRIFPDRIKEVLHENIVLLGQPDHLYPQMIRGWQPGT